MKSFQNWKKDLARTMRSLEKMIEERVQEGIREKLQD